jgi:hypothetical protein
LLVLPVLPKYNSLITNLLASSVVDIGANQGDSDVVVVGQFLNRRGIIAKGFGIVE